MNLADLFTILVFASSLFFIYRWRVLGVLFSTMYVWLAITAAIKFSPGSFDWETQEDWPRLGWLLTLVWSWTIFGLVVLVSWLRKKVLARQRSRSQ